MSPTHLLSCSHVIGGNRKRYSMPCDVIAVMPDGRVKVRVYGDRNWKNTQDKSRVRYVDASRVSRS